MLLKCSPQIVNYNLLFRSDYNIYQYIRMLYKELSLSDFGSAFLHLHVGNRATPLKLRQKFPPYVVFFVLYEFFVV